MDAYFYKGNKPRRASKEPSREQVDLFANSSESDHAAEIALLVPLAQRLATSREVTPTETAFG